MSQSKHYAYYPGCSLQMTAHAYDQTARRISEMLGLNLQELEDWNCCGATEYMSTSALPAYSLIARNLSLAVMQNSTDLVAACSACYLNLRKANNQMAKYPDLNEKVNRALAAGGISYTPDTLRIRHLLDVIVEDVGYEAVAAQVKQPLNGLRIAPYYGCLIVRPSVEGYDAEYPMHLDKLMQTLGARVVEFPLKTHCCGGHMTQISEETAFEMIRQILHNAAEYEADAIVTICPMCQLNLDVYQPHVNAMFGTHFNIPVLFFTQFMALAFGLTFEEAAIGGEFIPALAALRKIGQEEPEQAAPRRRNKKALPIPES
jgi:heterodisulfide reductase subunit B